MELKKTNFSALSLAVVSSILIILLSFSTDQVMCRPSIEQLSKLKPGSKELQHNACVFHTGGDDARRMVRELCQRCAKVTKSKYAYPMCCTNEEDARKWCSELLMIG